MQIITPRRATLALLWLLAIGGTLSTWNLGWIGTPSFEAAITYQTPRPELFACLIAVSACSGFGVIAFGVASIRRKSIVIGAIHLVSGAAIVASLAMFILNVLGNESENIPISGTRSKITEPVTRFRLFNLNALHGFPEFAEQRQRYHHLKNIVEHFRPEIVVLQEVSDTTEFGSLLERLQGLPNFAYGRANGSRRWIGFEEGSAMLSRLPIADARRIVLQPRASYWENRIALLAKIMLGEKEMVTIIGVHLSDSAIANDQAEWLISAMASSMPDIIVGDFNAEPASRAVLAIAKAGFERIEPAHAIHGTNRHKLPHELAPSQVIDHLFVSKSFLERWRVDEAVWMLTSKAVDGDVVHARPAVSDHDAIVADFVRR